ncbi:MAG: hypothetical protein ND895_04770 [Pyrinomonadaceae bacterium]|nr:hypothetical protein [Pyrinomonadaceae bacterium]
MSAEVEKWRVNTIEGIFETDLETLKQWINEGCVLPTDKVSKGNLSWIEAGRAPMLRSTFNGETPATVTAVDPPDETLPALPDQILHHQPGPMAQPDQLAAAAPTSWPATSPSHLCYQHPERPTKHICRSCATPFCEDCTKLVGTSKVAMCPLCGDLCNLFEHLRTKALHQEFQGSGFGFADFTRALRYPLQHKIALLFGAGLYGFLLLAGFRGRVIASVIMFGCISHVISQVAWGRLNRSFLPDFSEFSLVDDLVMPLVLGIGITIVTWGPAILLLCVLIFGVISGAQSSPAGGLNAPGTGSSDQLAEEDLSTLLDPNADPTKQAEASKKLDQLRPGYQMSKDAEKSQRELSDPTADVRLLMSYFQAPLLIVLLLLLSLCWGIFYYPMALAVAGYTESFGSVINPLVGLDTIRRMGGTYYKAFGMVLLIQIVGFVVTLIVAVITAPFALPFFGNLPATFIDGTLTFYFNLVVACILGLSLFKCADRLGITTD